MNLATLRDYLDHAEAAAGGVACRHDAQRRVGMSLPLHPCRPAASPRDGMPPKLRNLFSVRTL